MSYNRYGWKWPGLLRKQSGNHFTFYADPACQVVGGDPHAIAREVWRKVARPGFWLRLWRAVLRLFGWKGAQ